MKKIILAVLFLIGCAYAINVILVRKYKKENEELLQYAMKQERLNIKQVRLNIQLSRNAIANHYYREFSWNGSKEIDTLVFILDSILKNYPKYNSAYVEKFRHLASHRGNKQVFNFEDKFKMNIPKSEFEIEVLRYIKYIIDENYRMIVCGSPNLIITPNGFSTPLGVPLPFYAFTYFGFISPKEIKNLKNYSLDTSGQDLMVGYFPAEKIGTYRINNLGYIYKELGGEIESGFDPFEYTVTEPDIRTTLVDKNYLNLNQENRVSFNFGRYKLKDVIIKIEGASYKPIDDNTYSIYPTNKKVKIKYSLNTHYNNHIMDLGYKEYEAR